MQKMTRSAASPIDICGQSMSITCNWHRMYRLKDRDTLYAFEDSLKSIRARKNPRIVAMFDEDDLDSEIYDWEPEK